MRDWISSTSERHPYGAASVMIAAVTAFGLAARPTVRAANLDVLYLLAVFVSALRWGRRPAMYCALTGAVIFDFCLIPPQFSFAITDLAYLITLAGFLTVAIVTSELASRARDAMLAERKRADAEAGRRAAEVAGAELASATHAKDVLLDRIAHELRSPLTAIAGRVQLLQKTLGDPEETGRSLAKLGQSAQILQRLVGDLLDASRMHVGKLRVRLQTTVLLTPVARAIEDLNFAAAEKGVTLESRLDRVPDILADPDRIEQIVNNLVINAIKFTLPGGRIVVRLCQAESAIELSVSDTGVGISPEFLPLVFEPFSQAESDMMKQDGLGLGLAIVKNLVHAHGAEITVTSPGPGLGTIFTVLFPLGHVSALPAAIAEVNCPSPTIH